MERGQRVVVARVLRSHARVLLRILAVAGAVALAVPVGLLVALRIASRANGPINRTNGAIVTGGETRRYLLHVPDSYDGTRPVALVLSIHGFAQWPANQEDVTGWSELADEEGFLVAYPLGTGFPLRWASQDPASPQTSKDIQFLSDLIDTLCRDYPIDTDRIHVNGLSNGGGMAFVLACALSDRVASIGTVAGLFTYPWDACERARPVPLIAFHGTADPIVPFEGGSLPGTYGAAPHVAEWVAEYAARNGCTERRELPRQGSVRGVAWTGGADVELYTIERGGHTWPGGSPLPAVLTGSTSADIDATRMMWEFFTSHPLR